MTNEKTESSSEIAERLAKILNNQCPVIADGESYGIEPRRAALIIAPIVRAAIEAAIATEARRWCPDSPCSEHHQVPRPDCPTCLGAWALKLTSTVERLQADLAAAEAERLEIQRAIASSCLIDPTEDDDVRYSLTDILNWINSQNRRHELLLETVSSEVAAAEQRGREAEREECARHFERGAQFLCFRDEQVRYREIAATIRARGTNSNEPKG